MRRSIIIIIALICIFPKSIIFEEKVYADSGVHQPEYTSFEPVDGSNLVDLLTGDFTYTIPIINIPGPSGGYPLALGYHAGIKMEQDASWVGLGWNINAGAISRSISGYPDDWYDKRVDRINYSEESGDNYSAYISVSDPSSMLGASFSVDWGTNRSVTPALGVHAGIKGTDFNVGLNTNGNISVGYSPSKDSEGAISSLSFNLSGNLEGEYLSVSSSYSMASVGITLTSEGAYASAMGALSVPLLQSANNSSDYSTIIKTINDHSVIIPLTAVFISGGFKHQRYTSRYHKQFGIGAFGSLYSYYAQDPEQYTMQNKERDMDIYTNNYDKFCLLDPYFRRDDRKNHCSLSLPSYDSYIVSAQGLNGSMSLRLMEYGSLVRNRTNDKYRHESSLLETLYDHYVVNEFTKRPIDFDDNEKVHFYFNGEAGGYKQIKPGEYLFEAEDLAEHYNSFHIEGEDAGTLLYTTPDGKSNYNPVTYRSGGSKFVKWFRNWDLRDDDMPSANGFIQEKNIREIRHSLGDDFEKYFDLQGIGGYMITAADGKTYHYSIPVYQFEVFNVNAKKDDEKNSYNMERKFDKYAYTWLLTTITGPDYIDKNNNGIADPGDYGYWVNFNYGKWTDGYIWRNPYNQDDWNSNNFQSEWGSYSLGRKQLYYLNTIETKSHVAYFVKELREDGLGIKPEFVKEWTFADKFEITDIDELDDGIYDVKINSKMQYLYYLEKHETLKLSKIILVPRSQANVKPNDAVDNIKDHFIFSFKIEETVEKEISSWIEDKLLKIFLKDFVIKKVLDLFNESKTTVNKDESFRCYYSENVIDVNDFIDSNDDGVFDIEDDALKIIEFDQDYSLCPQNPSSKLEYSANPFIKNRKGKLTLNKVNFYARGKKRTVPPYEFDYNGTDKIYQKEGADTWGNYIGDAYNNMDSIMYDRYDKPNIDTWSLSDITMPTGGKISVKYESDTYYREAATAFSNKHPIQQITYIDEVKYLITLKQDNLNLHEYFTPGQSYLVNFPYQYIDIYSHSPTPEWLFGGYHSTDELVEIDEINNRLIFNYTSDPLPSSAFFLAMYSQRARDKVNYGYCFSDNPDLFGGGLRVKEISVNADYGVNYVTSYEYTNPENNRSSGITSYSPVNITYKYIPYIYEIPAPGVMYSYVTEKSYSAKGELTGKTVYNFNTLTPTNNENAIEFKLGEYFEIEDVLPQTEILSKAQHSHGYEFNINSRTSVIHDKTSLLGTTNYVENYNEFDHLLSRTDYIYSQNENNYGLIQESFNELRSFKHYESSYDNYERINYLTSVSKKIYPLFIKTTQTTNSYGNSQTSNISFDFITGNPKEIFIKDFSNKKLLTRTLFAHEKYSGMRSKVIDKVNKNMLSQLSGNYLYLLDPVSFESDNGYTILGTLSANIQTWNNEWVYRDFASSLWSDTDPTLLDDNEKIWRKHQNFAWKGEINTNGTYKNFTDYSWLTPENNEANGWVKTNETTRYSHFSQPLEAFDINNMYASSKMGYDKNLIIANVANANYSSFAYTGFEQEAQLIPEENWYSYDGEVYGDKTIGEIVEAETGIIPHTGKYMYKFKSTKIWGAKFKQTVKAKDSYNLEGIQAGRKYRASVWVHKDSDGDAALIVDMPEANGGYEQIFKSSDKGMQFGDWILLNLDFEIKSNYASTVTVYLKNPNGSDNVYFDDFRVHPIDAPMTSYVYNEVTNNLTAILNTNNIATFYDYDEAGRLIRTWKETPTGKKKVSEHEQYYAINSVLVSGYVKEKVNPVAHVKIHFTETDGSVTTTYTNSSGYYEKVVIKGTSGTISAEKGLFIFDPLTIDYSDIQNDTPDQDFDVEIYKVRGTVVDLSGIGIKSATITIDENGNSTVTNTDGSYEIEMANIETFTISVSKDGFVFLDNTQEVNWNEGDISVNDFLGSNILIEGKVLYNLEPLSGVSFSIDHADITYSFISDETGHYKVPVPSGFSETITPNHEFFNLNPIYKDYENVTLSKTNQDYVSGDIYISGNVKNKVDEPLEDINLTISDGDKSAIVYTNASGNYKVGVNNTFNGELSIDPVEGTFEVISVSSGTITNPNDLPYTFTNITEDFTVNLKSRPYYLSGTVKNSAGTAGQPDVVMQIKVNGEEKGTKTTDANGNYTFAIYGGSNIVIETVSERFNPESWQITTLEDRTDLDFSMKVPKYLSGRVSGSNGDIEGVGIEITGSDLDIDQTVQYTDANGNYTFAVYEGLDIKIEPVVTDPPTSYLPKSHDVSSLQNDVSGLDFSYNVHTVSGNIKNYLNKSCSEVLIELKNPAGITINTTNTTTDDSYNIEFLASSGDFTIVATKTNYNFPDITFSADDQGSTTADITELSKTIIGTLKTTAGDPILREGLTQEVIADLPGREDVNDIIDAGQSNYELTIPDISGVIKSSLPGFGWQSSNISDAVNNLLDIVFEGANLSGEFNYCKDRAAIGIPFKCYYDGYYIYTTANRKHDEPFIITVPNDTKSRIVPIYDGIKFIPLSYKFTDNTFNYEFYINSKGTICDPPISITNSKDVITDEFTSGETLNVIIPFTIFEIEPDDQNFTITLTGKDTEGLLVENITCGLSYETVKTIEIPKYSYSGTKTITVTGNCSATKTINVEACPSNIYLGSIKKDNGYDAVNHEFNYSMSFYNTGCSSSTNGYKAILQKKDGDNYVDVDESSSMVFVLNQGVYVTNPLEKEGHFNTEDLDPGLYRISYPVDTWTTDKYSKSYYINIPELIVTTSKKNIVRLVNASGEILQKGSIDLDVSGGYGDYEYTWTINSNARSIHGIEEPGTYSVVVIDQSGKRKNLSFDIILEFDNLLEATIDSDHFDCGTESVLSSNVTGGSGSYSHSWKIENTTTDKIVATSLASTFSYTFLTNNNYFITLVVKDGIQTKGPHKIFNCRP